MAETKDIQEYSREWYEKMVQIWRDRIAMMSIRDTGALAASITGAGLQIEEMQMQADFRFLDYGLAVDTGSGKYYDSGHRNEKGQLSFLDQTYRISNKLGKKRVARPWFSTSWAISQRVLADRYALAFGEKFIGLFDSLEKND